MLRSSFARDRALSVFWALVCVLVLFFAPRAMSRPLSGIDKILVYKTGIPEVKIHRELSTASIQQLSGFHRSRTWQNPGLTVGGHELQTDFRLAGLQVSGGKNVKAWVESMNVTFRYTDLDVYVSSDYLDDSCEAKEIHRHEMDHLAVHRRVYAKYRLALKKALLATRFPTKERPAIYKNLSAARNDMAKRLRAATEGTYAKFKRELSSANDRLDTPANYKAIQRRCKGW
jgi:hypothetical protein